MELSTAANVVFTNQRRALSAPLSLLTIKYNIICLFTFPQKIDKRSAAAFKAARLYYIPLILAQFLQMTIQFRSSLFQLEL